MTTEANTPILSLRQICKATVPIQKSCMALILISMREVVALLGENGASKSTVSNIIAGSIPPSSGEMTWQGTPYAPTSPRQAMDVRNRADPSGIAVAAAAVDCRECFRWPLAQAWRQS